MLSCNKKADEHAEETQSDAEEQHEEVQEAMLTQQQYDALGMEVKELQQRNMTAFVEANGELEVPPQSEANVTAVIGGNISSIQVIEGDEVRKGEVLAYVHHPDIVKVQTEFLSAYNQLQFQQKKYNRQKKLYDAGVGSGETFQRAETEYESTKALFNGLRAQIQLLQLNPQRIIEGEVYKNIPITSPINGAVQKVNIKTGQYVQAQTNMFEIVNTDHVHADLMVFEKDVSKVKVGQKVKFTVESLPGKELSARIISISQTFEQDPKALHVHAEIDHKPENLIPGMYVRGKIAIEDTEVPAFPESAVAKEGEKYFVFTAEREGEGWSFKPVEVIVGESADDWTAVDFLVDVKPETKFAYNNAYYLMAEMRKGEGGGHHH